MACAYHNQHHCGECGRPPHGTAPAGFSSLSARNHPRAHARVCDMRVRPRTVSSCSESTHLSYPFVGPACLTHTERMIATDHTAPQELVTAGHRPVTHEPGFSPGRVPRLCADQSSIASRFAGTDCRAANHLQDAEGAQVLRSAGPPSPVVNPDGSGRHDAFLSQTSHVCPRLSQAECDSKWQGPANQGGPENTSNQATPALSAQDELLRVIRARASPPHLRLVGSIDGRYTPMRKMGWVPPAMDLGLAAMPLRSQGDLGSLLGQYRIIDSCERALPMGPPTRTIIGRRLVAGSTPLSRPLASVEQEARTLSFNTEGCGHVINIFITKNDGPFNLNFKDERGTHGAKPTSFGASSRPAAAAVRRDFAPSAFAPSGRSASSTGAPPPLSGVVAGALCRLPASESQKRRQRRKKSEAARRQEPPEVRWPEVPITQGRPIAAAVFTTARRLERLEKGPFD